MKSQHRFFILGAALALMAGCKAVTQTELNGGSGSGANGPGYLYAGMFFDGIFRSTDNGLDWVQTDAGLTCDSILAIASLGNYLFAGSYGQGIFRSVDNGETWTQTNAGLSNNLIASLLPKGSTLLAGTYPGSGQQGVFRSTDDGNNWSLTELTSESDRAMTAMGPFVFAGSQGQGGISRSSDDGVSWTQSNNGLSSFLVYSMTASGQTLLAGTEQGLFLSNDTGVSWESTNVQGTIWSLFGNGNIFLAGIQGGELFRSTDGGIDWTDLGMPTGSQINTFASDGVRIYAGTVAGGVFVSSDSGLTWAASNNGIEGDYVWTLAIH